MRGALTYLRTNTMVNLNPQGAEISAKIVSVEETTLSKILDAVVQVDRVDGVDRYTLIKASDKAESFLAAIKRFPKNVNTSDEKEQHKLSRLVRDGLNVTYQLEDGSKRYEFVVIPKLTGWTNSNLKKIMDKNKLPNDTKEWAGKSILVAINSEGFPELSK